MSLRSFAAPVALAALIACLPGCGAMKFVSSEPADQGSLAAGNAAFDQKDYARACQDLSKAGTGAGAETLTKAGVACAKAGQDKAETSFKAALSANPAYAPAMEGLGQTAGIRLHGVSQADAPLRSVAEQALEKDLFIRRVDDQDIFNPGHHQRGQRKIDHRFVIDGHELFRHGPGQWV